MICVRAEIDSIEKIYKKEEEIMDEINKLQKGLRELRNMIYDSRIKIVEKIHDPDED